MRNKQSILFLLPTFDSLGPRNIRAYNIILHLKHDFDISIICFQTNSENKSINNVEINRLSMSCINKCFLFKSTTGYKPRSGLAFINRAVSFILRKVLILDGFLLEYFKIKNFLKNRKFDYVVASIKPESMGLIAAKLKTAGIINKDVIYDIGDPLSNNSANKSSSFKEAILSFIEKMILKRANSIIVTNKYTKQYYIEKLHIINIPIYIIPQGVDIDLIQKDISPDYSDKISMIYAGSFYPELRDPTEFIKAVNMADKENFIIKIFGSTDLNFNVKKTRVILEERVNQEYLFKEYAKSNIILYFDNAYGIQTSGKIYEVLALNKPILFIYSNNNSPVYIEHKNNLSILFVKNNCEDLCDCLINLQSLLIRMPKNNKSNKQYTWLSRANLYLNAIVDN